MTTQTSLTILGGTGRIARPFVEQFLVENVSVRLLARNPVDIQARYLQADVLPGSMFDPAAVRRALDGAGAVFLITPIGPCNQVEIEVEAAKVAIPAATETGTPHLFFLSTIRVDQPTHIPLLDVKKQIERLLAESGLSWTSLRCGTFMEDVLDQRMNLLRRGLFFFPVPTNQQFTFTCQRDVARVAARLLPSKNALNGPLDVVEPQIRTPRQVAELVSKLLKHKVVACGRWPWQPILRLARPLLGRRDPKLLTILPLVGYLGQYGYCGDTAQLRQILPSFTPTSLEDHLRQLLPAM